ncbi:hypothetical protein [Mycobacterium sp. NPDC050853]|uniref:hypothetical protein n=1 Tax=Mycobacterium sp. NPDC050853 TaxID=3155160 RepID=UPI0034002C38
MKTWLRWSNVLAIVVILVVLGVFYQTVIRTSVSRFSRDDIPAVTVPSGDSIDLYGVAWRMHELEVPDLPRDPGEVIAINGRPAVFLFERTLNGRDITHWSRKEYPPCIASVFDQQSRRWANGEFSTSTVSWLEEGRYDTRCSQDSDRGQFVLAAMVPSDAQLEGVDVSFKESSGKISTVRFEID